MCYYDLRGFLKIMIYCPYIFVHDTGVGQIKMYSSVASYSVNIRIQTVVRHTFPCVSLNISPPISFAEIFRLNVVDQNANAF
jgi:hypothetical protein